MKHPKKNITNDMSIDNAEQKLNIKYPRVIRDRLKKNNGFYWGSFRFFCVLDEDDRAHTFDDVVRENQRGDNTWQNYLPKDQVCIASEDNLCLTINTNKDGKIYYYVHDDLSTTKVFANNDQELQTKLDQQEKEFGQYPTYPT